MYLHFVEFSRPYALVVFFIIFKSNSLSRIKIHFVGDLHGLNTLENQPAKIAAMEGVWETQNGAPLVLFAIPDEETKTNKYSLEIPRLASLILTHDLDGELKGLNEFDGVHPPVAPVFYSFRIMVGMGLIMLTIAWWFSWQLKRHGELKPFQLKILVAMSFSGWIATLAGWYVTEIGRQPFLVNGVLTTAEAVTTIPSSNVAISLVAYLSIYVVLLFAYVKTIFSMARKAVTIEEYDLSLPGLPEHRAPLPAVEAKV